tara:strand:- start:291 stop:401 length:111 start_codon:yes stop_codon:yes gene_type:complete
MHEENTAPVVQANQDLGYERLGCHSSQAQVANHQLR